MKMNTYYLLPFSLPLTPSTLVRSGASELAIANYQRQQLAVIYLVVLFFLLHAQFLLLGTRARVLPPRASYSSSSSSSSTSMWPPVFPFIVASHHHQVQVPPVQTAGLPALLRRAGEFPCRLRSLRQLAGLDERHSGQAGEGSRRIPRIPAVERLQQRRDGGRGDGGAGCDGRRTAGLWGCGGSLFLVTEQPPLTPWPCHTPTQKEIEDAATEGIGERVQEEGVMKNEDIQMVYSTVHGWA